MKTSVERVDDTTVKLSVTVEAERVGAAIDAAARRLGTEVRVPGFRPGRVPRRVLESRIGKGAVVQEAAREALPGFYAEAARAEDLAVVGPPEFSVDTFEDGKDAAFAATVEVLPVFDVPNYAGLQVPHPDWEVTDTELAQQLDALRERFAELGTVERPLQAGDYAVITVTASRDGQKVEEASVEDLLYAVPEPAPEGDEQVSELDRNLLGAQPGAVLRFRDTLGTDYGDLAGQELDFTALVKQVKAKRLPELDDDFAITASEYDTIHELRDALGAQLAAQKKAYARQALRGEVVEAVCALVEVPLPESLVNDDLRFRVNRIAAQAKEYDMSLESYLAAAGQDAESLVDELREEARRTVKGRLVVDAVGREVGITVSEADVGAEIGRQAARLGRPPEELAKVMTTPDRIAGLVSDVFRRKAIDHLVESVQVLSAPPEDPASDEPAATGEPGEPDEPDGPEGAPSNSSR
ncbi:MAG: trigger factor [Euzebyales bacterium]|nr:trigger factor [Euzebyales bacterium]